MGFVNFCVICIAEFEYFNSVPAKQKFLFHRVPCNSFSIVYRISRQLASAYFHCRREQFLFFLNNRSLLFDKRPLLVVELLRSESCFYQLSVLKMRAIVLVLFLSVHIYNYFWSTSFARFSSNRLVDTVLFETPTL